MAIRRVAFAALGAAVFSASVARAEAWITGELPAAIPVSTPHVDVFNAGAMPALGGYLSLGPNVALGLRVRLGYLANGDPVAPGMREPGRGGLVAGTLAMRLHLAGTWLEAAGGGGVTGHDAVPTFEVGVGHGFSIGRWSLGPSVRYLRVIGGSDVMDPGSAGIVLVGLEVTMGGRHRARVTAPLERVEVVAAPPPAPVPPPPPPPPAPVDRDGDSIVDTDDRCPDEAEVINGVDDGDGCPDAGLFVVENDRIVLDDRILFDLNRARIHSGGRKVIAAIAEAWRVHPEWVHLSIEGHCDVRGPVDYNTWLSEVRAQRVQDALVAAGVPVNVLDAVGYGASRPRDPGRSERAHARNRRVEFGITRGSRQ